MGCKPATKLEEKNFLLVNSAAFSSEAIWTKYSTIDSENGGQSAGGSEQPGTSGVAGFSKAALTGTVVMTLAAGVFFV